MIETEATFFELNWLDLQSQLQQLLVSVVKSWFVCAHHAGLERLPTGWQQSE